MRTILATLAVTAGLALSAPAATAAEPRTEYMPCGQEPVLRDCVLDPHATGGDSHVYIDADARVWRLPHHISHSLLFLTSPHGAYYPCATEDSKDCVWDARHRVDGMGQSFYAGMGRGNDKVTIWRLPHHIAHFLLAR